MPVHYFYDWTDDKTYAGDDEGALVRLCDLCAEDAGDAVGHASNGSDDVMTCDECDWYEADDAEADDAEADDDD